jgi:hypothetical protein
LFTTIVVDTGGNLPPVSLTPAANLPPVSLTPVFAAGIVDTGGEFATGINNTSETGGKICHRCRWGN